MLNFHGLLAIGENYALQKQSAPPSLLPHACPPTIPHCGVPTKPLPFSLLLLYSYDYSKAGHCKNKGSTIIGGQLDALGTYPLKPTLHWM